MTEGELKYTDRQLGLLRGTVEPDSNEEWNYIQDHANDMLPDETSARKPLVSVTADDLARSEQFDHGSTEVAHQSAAMDKRQDEKEH